MEERVGTRTIAAAGAEIERNIIVVNGVQGIKEVVADAGRDRQITVSPSIRPEHNPNTGFSVALPAEESRYKKPIPCCCSGSWPVKYRSMFRSASTLVEQHPSDFKSELDSVFAFGPGKIIDQIEALGRIVSGGRAGQRTESGNADSKRNRREIGGVIDGLIHSEL